MKEKIKIPVASAFLFIVLLTLAGSLGGAAGEIAYYLAFCLPIAIGLYAIHKYGNSENEERKIGIFPDTDGILTALPTVIPIILITAAVSLLISYLMSLFGMSNENVPSEPFALALLLHALIPAVLEEMLFRYIPIRLIPENPRCAIALSSIVFAFAHANIFQIPYALVAGILFSALTVVTGSIAPAIFVHLLNNAISLTMMYGYGGVWLYSALGALLAASFITLVIRRRHYADLIKGMLFGKVMMTKELIVFICVTAFLAVTNLLA